MVEPLGIGGDMSDKEVVEAAAPLALGVAGGGRGGGRLIRGELWLPEIGFLWRTGVTLVVSEGGPI